MSASGPSILRRRIDVDVSAVAPAGVRTLAVEVVARELPYEGLRTVLTCLPGGGMSRRYFDLRTEEGGDTWSMAAHLAARGVIVVLLDHPAVGDSDVPDDPYELSPAVVAEVDAHATRAVLDGLRAGTLVPGLAPVPSLVSIGCGHSMGGMLTVYAQAATPLHDGLALLGFAGGGLLDRLSDEERTFADDPDGFALAAARLTRERFGRPLSRGSTGPSPFLLAVEVPDDAIAAITAAGGNLLNVCGLTSMIPGASRPQLDAVDVPVFLGVGQFDITGASHQIPAQFPRCNDITLFVCPHMGHNHNVAPTRTVLWDRLLDWSRALAARVGG